MANNSKNDAENSIIITLENGSQAEGVILFTCEANHEEYVFYEFEGKVLAAKYDENNNLKEINHDEWSIVEKIYNDYVEAHKIEGDIDERDI